MLYLYKISQFNIMAINKFIFKILTLKYLTENNFLFKVLTFKCLTFNDLNVKKINVYSFFFFRILSFNILTIKVLMINYLSSFNILKASRTIIFNNFPWIDDKLIATNMFSNLFSSVIGLLINRLPIYTLIWLPNDDYLILDDIHNHSSVWSQPIKRFCEFHFSIWTCQFLSCRVYNIM